MSFRSIVIDHLQKRFLRKTTILFAYSRYTDKYSVADLLASFVKQLAQDHQEIVFPILEPIYDDYKKKDIRPSNDALLYLLKKLLNLFEKAYIIVDALDEAPDDTRPDLLDALRLLPASLFLTSRPLEMLEQYHSNAAYIHIERENQNDIEHFLEKKINKSPWLTTMLRGKEAIRKEICTKLKEKSQGM